MDAAFFDLDKTVISRSSMMAFAGPFRREGLVTRRTLARGAWTQLLYVHRGAGPKRLAHIQRSVLTITAGWEQERVRRVVAEHLADAVDPITYAEARRVIAEHRDAGRRIYLVSAAPEDIAEPIGRHLGVDETIASRALVEDGCYSGTLERYAYGEIKAELIVEAAQRDGVDLVTSWAYSDSATDAPMLRSVGHAVAVNPDRALRDLAGRSGWEIIAFRQLGRPLDDAHAVAATGSWPATFKALFGRERWATLVSAAALMTTTGGVTAWWWHRKTHLRHRLT